MAVTSGFFNSVNGDIKYNADQISEYFRGIVSQGVFQNLDSGLAVSAGTGMSVSVAAGRAIIQNKWVQNSAALNLTISAASETYGRKDAVVIRLDNSSREISITVKTGTPAASPVAPSMTRNATTYEMALAYVNVAAGATSVTVTDKRSDSSVCGWAAVAQAASGEVDQMLNDMKTGFDGVSYDSPAAQVIGSDNKIVRMVDNISTTTRNLFGVMDVQIGKAHNTSINPNRATNFIPVEPSTSYVVTLSGGTGFEAIYWYQKESADVTTSISNGSVSNGLIITTAANCYVLAIQFNKTSVSLSDFNSLKLQIEKGKIPTSYTSNVSANDFDARKETQVLSGLTEKTRNIFQNLIIGRAANTSITPDRATAYIPVMPGTTYYVSYSDISIFDAVYWYQKTDVDVIYSVSEGVVSNGVAITINSTVQYLAIQFNKTSVSISDFANVKMQVETGSKTQYIPTLTGIDYIAREATQKGTRCNYTESRDISVFNKILCAGDSLTAGTFNHNEGGTTEFEVYAKYSYPTFLTKLCGVVTDNKGIGGKTSDEWYALMENTDLSGFDCAILQFGVNDYLKYDGWTQASIDGFTDIIEKIQNENENIFIFVATIIPATSYSGAKADEVSQGIRDLVSSLADSHVILLDMAAYGHTKDSSAYNCGHLSAYGYQRLAQDYVSYISWYMTEHKDVFRQVQFVGTNYSYNG